jgi:hypothetical protein
MKTFKICLNTWIFPSAPLYASVIKAFGIVLMLVVLELEIYIHVGVPNHQHFNTIHFTVFYRNE